MQWMLPQNPTTPIADGRYPRQTSADSNRSHSRFRRINGGVPALPCSGHRTLPDGASQVKILCTPNHQLTFLCKPAKTVYQFRNVHHVDSILKPVNHRGAAARFGGLAVDVAAVEYPTVSEIQEN